jgi:hypothetical protein
MLEIRRINAKQETHPGDSKGDRSHHQFGNLINDDTEFVQNP